MFDFFKKTVEEDLKEFTDEQGKKWKQTSTEDLFSMKEFEDIFSTIEKEKDNDEIILARIDFQKVNKEYYETAVELQKKIEQQNKLIQHIAEEAKKMIDRKGEKLKELIEYIQTLHAFIAKLGNDPDLINKIERNFNTANAAPIQTHKSTYIEVNEITIDPNDVNIEKHMK
jgi:predicted phage tail protein